MAVAPRPLLLLYRRRVCSAHIRRSGAQAGLNGCGCRQSLLAGAGKANRILPAGTCISDVGQQQQWRAVAREHHMHDACMHACMHGCQGVLGWHPRRRAAGQQQPVCVCTVRPSPTAP